MFEQSTVGNFSLVSATKAMYKPLSIVSSVAGGLLAGKIFTEIWQRVSPTDQEPPEPQDLARSTRELFIAAAIQGLIIGVIRAGLARAQAQGFRALTDEDPQ